MARGMPVLILLSQCFWTGIFGQNCEVGKEEWRTACSHLSAYAGWGKVTRDERHNSCHYGAPEGWVILENRVNFEEKRGEVDASVDVINDNVQSNIETSAKHAYDRAIQLAVGYELMDVAGKIRAKWQHVQGTYSQIEHSGSPVLRGRVRAKGDGHFFNRKSSAITVSIDALLQCVGPLSEEGIFEELKKEFKLQDSVQTSAIGVALAVALLLLLLVFLVVGIVFCYWRRLLCFKNRSKKVDTITEEPVIHTIEPLVAENKIIYRKAPLPPIKPQKTAAKPPEVPPKPDLKMFLNGDSIPNLHVPLPEPPPSYEESKN